MFMQKLDSYSQDNFVEKAVERHSPVTRKKHIFFSKIQSIMNFKINIIEEIK